MLLCARSNNEEEYVCILAQGEIQIEVVESYMLLKMSFTD